MSRPPAWHTPRAGSSLLSSPRRRTTSRPTAPIAARASARRSEGRQRVEGGEGATAGPRAKVACVRRLHCSIPHRTLDPEEADFFYLPIYLTCFIWPVLGWADGPW